jgi:hypothetical protein
MIPPESQVEEGEEESNTDNNFFNGVGVLRKLQKLSILDILGI